MSAQMPLLMMPVLTLQTKPDTPKLSFLAFSRAYDYMLVGSVLDPYLFPKTVIPTRAGIGSVLLYSILSAQSVPGHMLCNKLG